MRRRTDEYGAVVKRIASDHDAVFVDVQAAFNRFLSHRPGECLSQDRVHPNASGHLIIACAFLRAIDFTWEGLQV